MKLNKIMLKNRYPLPRIDGLDSLPHHLQQAHYFTKLDLKSRYHQVRVKEDDTWKTDFKTSQDDILVYSATREEHISHLTQVLKTLRKHQMLANIKKCDFAQHSLVYLGYVIGGGKFKMDPSKMEATMKWSVPTNVTKVRSFIGSAQYFRKFIASFSTVAALLHAITTSGKSLQWRKGQKKSFNELKKKIIKAPILTLPNLQQPFEVETDVSGYATEIFLMQGGRPIFYHSEVFHGAILNYPTYNKELYAMVQSVKKWKHYLMGKEKIIHTNHQLL
eukprot:PITA_20498